MTRRHPDAAALLALALFAVLSGEPRLVVQETQFRFTPALHASATHAEKRIDELIQRLEERRERVWQRLDERLRDFESRLADKEQRRRVRTATRVAS
jgi:hypothetical protein